MILRRLNMLVVKNKILMINNRATAQLMENLRAKVSVSELVKTKRDLVKRLRNDRRGQIE